MYVNMLKAAANIQPIYFGSNFIIKIPAIVGSTNIGHDPAHIMYISLPLIFSEGVKHILPSFCPLISRGLSMLIFVWILPSVMF